MSTATYPAELPTPAVGETVFRGSLRIHRMACGVKVTDTANAGKRGKVCRELWIDNELRRGDELHGLAALVCCYDTIDAIIRAVRDVNDLDDVRSGELTAFAVDDREVKAIDVAPTGYALQLETPHATIRADWDSFSISDKRDGVNEPTTIQGNKSSCRKFHKWLSANLASVGALTYREIVKAAESAGVVTHSFLAVD